MGTRRESSRRRTNAVSILFTIDAIELLHGHFLATPASARLHNNVGVLLRAASRHEIEPAVNTTALPSSCVLQELLGGCQSRHEYPAFKWNQVVPGKPGAGDAVGPKSRHCKDRPKQQREAACCTSASATRLGFPTMTFPARSITTWRVEGGAGTRKNKKLARSVKLRAPDVSRPPVTHARKNVVLRALRFFGAKKRRKKTFFFSVGFL